MGGIDCRLDIKESPEKENWEGLTLVRLMADADVNLGVDASLGCADDEECGECTEWIER